MIFETYSSFSRLFIGGDVNETLYRIAYSNNQSPMMM